MALSRRPRALESSGCGDYGVRLALGRIEILPVNSYSSPISLPRLGKSTPLFLPRSHNGIGGPTAALVTTASTSPLCAPMSTVNFSITLPNIPSLLLSAKASKRPLVIISVFAISPIIADLSAELRVGDEITWTSLAFPSSVRLRAWRDLSVDSRLEAFTAAMYWVGRRVLAKLMLHPNDRGKNLT